MGGGCHDFRVGSGLSGVVGRGKEAGLLEEGEEINSGEDGQRSGAPGSSASSSGERQHSKSAQIDFHVLKTAFCLHNVILSTFLTLRRKSPSLLFVCSNSENKSASGGSKILKHNVSLPLEICRKISEQQNHCGEWLSLHSTLRLGLRWEVAGQTPVLPSQVCSPLWCSPPPPRPHCHPRSS